MNKKDKFLNVLSSQKNGFSNKKPLREALSSVFKDNTKKESLKKIKEELNDIEHDMKSSFENFIKMQKKLTKAYKGIKNEKK
ncbi:MAG: hypothetical protein JXA94_06075 [Parachlamydiales bacterium]|nr:hypothetical protein [Parachlamydiales bacterium]